MQKRRASADWSTVQQACIVNARRCGPSSASLASPPACRRQQYSSTVCRPHRARFV